MGMDNGLLIIYIIGFSITTILFWFLNPDIPNYYAGGSAIIVLILFLWYVTRKQDTG